MCHPPHPSQGDIITYLLFRKQDFQSSEAETNSDVVNEKPHQVQLLLQGYSISHICAAHIYCQ